MRKLSFTMQENGKLPEGVKQNLLTILPLYAGKHLLMTIEEWRDRISDKQRKYYFSVIVDAFLKHFKDSGCNKEEMHSAMMKTIGGFNTAFVNPLTGEPEDSRKSLNDLTKAQAEGYFTLCRKAAAIKGFDVPLPNERDYDDTFTS